jgi:phosphate transport system substrate-binding protein
VCAVLLVAGVVAAACGSSSPTADKNAASHSKKSKATTTTTTVPAATTTTAATAVTTTTKAGTATTATPTTAAPAGAPGGSLSANPASSPAGTLTGVGASSIQPFYGRVFYQYNQVNKGVTINYAPSGSGPGVTAIQQNTASFGQSEIPMTAAQQAAAKGTVLQVPVDLGGVAVSYHVTGVTGGLHLDGPTLAKIYLRQITMWNDPAIVALNPGVTLPAENIVPVYRADTSGPGYDLDQYLIDTAGSAWTGAIGSSSASTTWPTAARASGTSGQQLNTGVATYIQQTEGAIGYVEYSYALAANFTNSHRRSPPSALPVRMPRRSAPAASTSCSRPERAPTRWPTSAGPCCTRSRPTSIPPSTWASSSSG